VSAAVAAEPRLTAGVVASVFLHGGLLAAFFFARSSTPAPQPRMIAVHMVAAPAATPAIGEVKATAPVAEAPTPPPKPAVTPKTVPPTPKPKAASPKQVSQTAPLKSAPKTVPDAPKAGAVGTGGKGADVANIDTPGIQFDYPFYTNNIVSQLVKRFGAMAGSLEAEVRFVIKRDGTVDPNSIKLVTPSGNWSFDNRALSAVESAANAKAFGALPPGFNEDILPVTFRFSPKIIR
jgi:outer membrane biosynthesis protein TonB